MATTTKGEQTRALILQNALDLFLERGYDDTTMRAIAERAGVSLGNSYYYFPSKEHLIQAFYARLHAEHLDASRPILESERDLKKRFLGVMRAHVEVAEPYHHVAGVLFRTAADPHSPLNPFSPESQDVRRGATNLFAEVLAGSRTRIAPELTTDLPNLLWTYHMGITLFWIHDDSLGRERTRRLIDDTVDLFMTLLKLAHLPLMKTIRRRLIRLVRQVTTPPPAASAPATLHHGQ